MNSPQEIENARLFEPRVELIKRTMESLLSVVELEKDGNIVKIDGFRLKNLTEWLAPASGNPMEVLINAGSRCNLDCIFCYNKGNPLNFPLKKNPTDPREEQQELLTRIKYYSPVAKSCLFSGSGEVGEMLAHPYIFNILTQFRKKSDQLIRLTTNGSILQPEFIEKLTNFKPLYLYLSLNSSSPQIRKKLMRDPRPEVAIQSLNYLKTAEIPFTVTIVPWPVDSMEDLLIDLEKTLHFANEFDPHMVVLQLPGFSKYFSPQEPFPMERLWHLTAMFMRNKRTDSPTPLVVMPTLFEENHFECEKNRALVIGMVKNSPAKRSGLRQGDIIKQIEGLPILNRPQARWLLSMLTRNGSKSVRVDIQRGEENLSLIIDTTLRDISYPYSPSHDFQLGIVMNGSGFEEKPLENLKLLIDRCHATQILFLSSKLMEPLLKQAIIDSPYFQAMEINIAIRVPENTFFGGNIIMGDLLVVQDFVDCLRKYLDECRQHHLAKPDLIVIPSSPFMLGRWGRDLTGVTYLEIERQVGIPVKLLFCDPILD